MIPSSEPAGPDEHAWFRSIVVLLVLAVVAFLVAGLGWAWILGAFR